jgi:hypothetical protein
MTKRLRLVLAVLALGAVVGTVSAAAAPPGRYRGTTAQKLSISFSVLGGSVRELVLQERGQCSTGQVSNGEQGPISAPIRNGKFVYYGKSPSGATSSQISGTFKGSRAVGTFKITARFNDAGDADPNGTITCTTGVVSWSATRI